MLRSKVEAHGQDMVLIQNLIQLIMEWHDLRDNSEENSIKKQKEEVRRQS